MTTLKSLKDLRNNLRNHPAFAATTKLEQLALKYNIKIIFGPKFHCELNPIEGLWCYMKWYVRKYTDQSFQKMKELIPLSRDQYKDNNINIKLIRRFWRSLNAYEADKTYGEVLQIYFGSKCKANNECHRRILENPSIL